MGPPCRDWARLYLTTDNALVLLLDRLLVDVEVSKGQRVGLLFLLLVVGVIRVALRARHLCRGGSLAQRAREAEAQAGALLSLDGVLDM